MKIKRYTRNATRPTLLLIEAFPELSVTIVRGKAADIPPTRHLRMAVKYLRRDEPPVLARANGRVLQPHTREDELFAVRSLRQFGVDPL